MSRSKHRIVRNQSRNFNRSTAVTPTDAMSQFLCGLCSCERYSNAFPVLLLQLLESQTRPTTRIKTDQHPLDRDKTSEHPASSGPQGIKTSRRPRQTIGRDKQPRRDDHSQSDAKSEAQPIVWVQMCWRSCGRCCIDEVADLLHLREAGGKGQLRVLRALLPHRVSCVCVQAG